MPSVPAAMSQNSVPWWRDAVFYQIYPLSFADSNGDGFGDLDGVIDRLDYLSETLGVDAIWFSPFYKSPMRDWGYDISDHTDVDPLFGSLADAERLIEECHRRGLRVVLDYVMNHTSDEHPWFVESRSSTDNSKRDWYVWRDAKEDGSLPTNWVSVFSGPQWTFDEATGQYYRHTFLPRQPDLNWRNEEVIETSLDVARFWLDRGVDGFRLDTAHQMAKDPLERDNPPTPEDYVRPWKDMGEYDDFIHLYDFGHPDIHEWHRRFRAVLDSYAQETYSVGEIHIFDLPEWASYYGDLDQLHAPFNFFLMAADWDAPSIRAAIESVLWHVPAGGWTNWTLGNHDEQRLATRLGAGNARLAALLLLTLRGSPFLYYGDELGMQDVDVPAEDSRDPWGDNVSFLGRDGARTPMQWSPDDHAGFTTGEPWLPVAGDYHDRNVASQLGDPGSILNLYRRLLALRKASAALRRGSFLAHPSSDENVLVYRREADHDTKTILLNLSDTWHDVKISRGRVILSTVDRERTEQVKGSVPLAPREGVIVTHET